MNFFTFKKEKDPENDFDVTDLTMNVATEDLYDLLGSFENFLKGAGFIISGRLDLIDDEFEESENIRIRDEFNRLYDALAQIAEADNAQTRDSLIGLAQAGLRSLYK